MFLRPGRVTVFRRFYRDQRGAFAVSFVLMSGFLLGMASLGLEGSRYLYERARLSDAMEQASLALTAEDNGEGAERNYTLSKDWFKAYMRHDIEVFTPVIKVLKGNSPSMHDLSYVEYRVSGQTLQNSWLASSFFPSFDREVRIGDNGAARKYRSNIDVVFVTDFSGSMNLGFDGANQPLPPGEVTKLTGLKRIVLQLAEELYSYDMNNKVGFTPFAWGTRTGEYCTPQFVSNGTLPEDILASSTTEEFGKELEGYINIHATLNAIPHPVNDMRIPMDKINPDFCLKQAITHVVPLTSNFAEIAQIQHMTAHGGTLVSSGVLRGVQELAKGSASRKVLVIVSDGTDNPITNTITLKLLNAGMCDKIRSVLSTSQSVGKIAFIGVAYQPTVDWIRCVGHNNFYLPGNISQLEEDMRRAVFEEVGHNTLKDK